MDDQEKRKIWNREHYKRNREKRDTYHIEWVRRKRLDLIDKLGGRCNYCGERDPIVLDFDHINDDGAEHRRQKRSNLHTVAEDLKRYQILCKNCNWRKEYWRRQSAKHKRKAAQVHGGGST